MALDRLPGTYDQPLYVTSPPELDAGLQTPVQNLYAVGDGAGITRGLVQASAAGVIAARSILNGG